MLHVNVEEKGDAIYVALSGRMDGGPTCDSLCSTIKSGIGEGQRRFVFDLEDLTSMSSRGIGCLISNYVSIHTARGSMVLLSPNERVQHVLEVTHLVPTVFNVIDTGTHTSPDTDTSQSRSGRDESEIPASGRDPRAGGLGQARRRGGQQQARGRGQGTHPRR